MKSVWQDAARRELQQRIGRLTPDARPAWGTMDAAAMVSHLAESTRMALGELPCAPKNLLFRYPPLKQLIIYALPFPKGVPTAPELIARTPGEWPGEVARLNAAIERLVKRYPSGPWPQHPAFGPLSARAWGALTYKHFDHHLRQFGV